MNNDWSTFNETDGYQRQIIEDWRNDKSEDRAPTLHAEMERHTNGDKTGWHQRFAEAAQAWLNAGGQLTPD